MRLIKVALANVETTVGAVRANAERVIALARHVGSLDLERERALQLPVVERDEWSG